MSVVNPEAIASKDPKEKSRNLHIASTPPPSINPVKVSSL